MLSVISQSHRDGETQTGNINITQSVQHSDLQQLINKAKEKARKINFTCREYQPSHYTHKHTLKKKPAPDILVNHNL